MPVRALVTSVIIAVAIGWSDPAAAQSTPTGDAMRAPDSDKVATRFQPTEETVGATISDEESGEWCSLPCTLQLSRGKHDMTVVGAQNAFVFTRRLKVKRPATYSVQKGTRGLMPLGIVTLSVGGAAALVGFIALIGGPGGGGSSNPAVGLPLLIGGGIAIPGGILLIINGRNRFSHESYDVASSAPMLTFQHNW